LVSFIFITIYYTVFDNHFHMFFIINYDKIFSYLHEVNKYTTIYLLVFVYY